MFIRIILILLSLLVTILFVASPVASFPSMLWFTPLILIGSLIAFYLLYFFLLFILSLCISKKKEYQKQNSIYRFFLDQTMEILCHFGRVKVNVENSCILPKEKCLLIYNHNSDFDNIILSVQHGTKKLLHISKPSNFKIPIAGPFIHRNLFLAINRENAKEAIKTLNKAANYISNDQFSIAISPEGTRNKSGKGLLPFRSGAFKLAFYAKCPIVICSLHDTYEIHKNFPWKRSKITLRYLTVLNYDDYKDKTTNDISSEVKELFIKDLNIKEEDLA